LAGVLFMIEFNKCQNCGAEMAAEDEKCPVCGAGAPKNSDGSGFSGASGGGGTGAFEPLPMSGSKKSAFAPPPGGRNDSAGPGIQGGHYEYGAGSRLSSSAVSLMVVFAIAGLIVSLVAAGILAIIFILSNVGARGAYHGERVFETMCVLIGFSFVVASCFAGIGAGYNLGAYICMRYEMVRRRLTIISIKAMLGSYLGAFLSAAVFTIIGHVIGLNYNSIDMLIFFNVLTSIGLCFYFMWAITQSEKDI
jgi:hypothetical protein